MIKKYIDKIVSDLSDDFENKRYGLYDIKALGYAIAVSCTIVFI